MVKDIKKASKLSRTKLKWIRLGVGMAWFFSMLTAIIWQHDLGGRILVFTATAGVVVYLLFWEMHQRPE